ncbi:sporulation protein YjcZ [Niallia circulans]|nr:sporulation protein YjcZ [Niallia circulans]NRG34388.1 sporulation protein YjcZ [Niallia circulans]QKH63945.1 sporulation protein YjcZ [Niallia circulans]
MGPAPFGYGAPYPAYGGVYGGFWYAFLIILFIVIILFWGFWAFGSFYR